jgi:hypothetical protein
MSDEEKASYPAPSDIARSFLEGLADRDFERLSKCFHPHARARLLIPPGLMTPTNAVGIAGKFRQWFGDADVFELEESDITQMSDRLHISYRIRLREDGEWYLCEQQTYCIVEEGVIEAIDLICSGFRPGEPARVS